MSAAPLPPSCWGAMGREKSRRWFIALLFLLPALLVSLAFSRIYTVATGVADVFHYYQAAFQILESSTWRDFLSASLTWAPLHPMLLALIVKLAGAEWTFLLSPIMAIGLMAGLGFMVWGVMKDAWSGLFTALAAFLILLWGHEHFGYFLLYPYRESLSLGLLSWSMAGVAWALQAERMVLRRFLLLASGGLMVAAAATREPACLAFIGLLSFIAAHRHGHPARRAGDMVVFMLPLVIALVILGLVFHYLGIVGSQQFSGWRQIAGGHDVGFWWGMVQEYSRFGLHVLGPWLGAMTLLGLCVMVLKSRAAVFMLVVSLVCTLALYATFDFYPRYALSWLVFMVPFAGVGLASAGRLMGRLAVRCGGSSGTLASFVLALALTIHAAGQSQKFVPWARISRSDIASFRNDLAPYVQGEEGRIMVDARCRLLEEVMLLYFGKHMTTVSGADATGGLFFKPENRAALTGAHVASPPVSMADHLAFRADLSCVGASADTPRMFHLGDALFSLHRVLPWSAVVSRERIDREHAHHGLIWLNFQHSGAGVERHARVVDDRGSVHYAWPEFSGEGLIPLYAGDLDFRKAPLWLEVTSSRPAPSRLLVASPGGAFALGQGRLPSALGWAAPPTRVDEDEKWGAVFARDAQFQFPLPVGLKSGTYTVTLMMQPRFRQPVDAVFSYQSQGGVLLTVTHRLTRAQLTHTLSVQAPFQSSQWPVSLTVKTPEPFDNHFRLTGISFKVE